MLSPDEIKFIQNAHNFLERDSLWLRLAGAVGKPADFLHKSLPTVAQKSIQKAVEKSLKTALKAALQSLPDSDSPGDEPQAPISHSIQASHKSRFMHGALTASSGALGGFFGGVGLIVELPVTTTLMMRNMASVAQQWGFSKNDPTTALECLYVFSLGSPQSKVDDQFESAYYTSRLALASALRNSAQYIAASSSKVLFDSIRKGSAPIVVNFISRIAAYFEIVVTEKMVAGAVPILGSVGSAALNVAFTDYFGQAAQYHFGLLALEKKYGTPAVQAIYRQQGEKQVNKA